MLKNGNHSNGNNKTRSSYQALRSSQSDEFGPQRSTRFADDFDVLQKEIVNHDDDGQETDMDDTEMGSSRRSAKFSSFIARQRNSFAIQKARPKKSKWNLQCDIDRAAIGFGLRMSLLLTFSSIFVFAGFPDGIWVLITVLFVCWFPSLDAASVIEKSIQRLIGTFIGCFLGLIVGFFSLRFETQLAEAWFMGTCILIVTFSVTFSAVQCKVNGIKIIKQYNYACILCCLTFGICVFPFYYGETDPRWKKAVWRCINVIIGCILGAFGSVIIAPKSTSQVIKANIDRQISLAGQVCEAVLHTAADAFSGLYVPLRLADEIMETPAEKTIRLRSQSTRMSYRSVKKDIVDQKSDEVLETYESAIKDYRAAKTVFPLLRYDPFQFGVPDGLKKSFKTVAANTLARSLRIQTTVVLLDGLIRNEPKHSFTEVHMDLFVDAGTLMREMLTVPLDTERSDYAARQLRDKLAQIRHLIVEMAATVAENPHSLPSSKSTDSLDQLINNVTSKSSPCNSDSESSGLLQYAEDENDDRHGVGAPVFVKGSNVCALLFLQLVEHLILRSIRLHSAWAKFNLIAKWIKA